MNIYRSDTMKYYKIVVPKDNIVQILNTIEEVSCIHMVDNNNKTPHNKDRLKSSIENISKIDSIYSTLARYDIHVDKITSQTTFDYIKGKMNAYSHFEEVSKYVARTHSLMSDYSNRMDSIHSRMFDLKHKIYFNMIVKDDILQSYDTK